MRDSRATSTQGTSIFHSFLAFHPDPGIHSETISSGSGYNSKSSLSLPPSQGIIFHVIASKTTIFISNSPFISLFACFLCQKCLNRKRSKLPHTPIYDTSVHFAVRTPITELNSCRLLMVVRYIGGPSGTSFQISTLIRMSSRYQELNFVPSYPALPYHYGVFLREFKSLLRLSVA